ncbi:hypothetical protein [Mycobacterium sp. D16Q16]|uniref:hypothetical protein n=1 Tax=Mycobacterium sp. D16Q16 TaxID=1855659 RepID=UPI00256FDB30|nr:hypothetical protein [Mycobacterium sp. D16Q16]
MVPCEEAELVLGEDGVPDGLAPEMRLERVGFTVGAGDPCVLGDSALGEFTARGISGSWCGAGAGA